MTLFYLSFTGDSGFLGACLVEVGDVNPDSRVGRATAIRESWRLKLNPGGEVYSGALSAEGEARVPREVIGRLLTLDDLRKTFGDLQPWLRNVATPLGLMGDVATFVDKYRLEPELRATRELASTVHPGLRRGDPWLMYDAEEEHDGGESSHPKLVLVFYLPDAVSSKELVAIERKLYAAIEHHSLITILVRREP